MKIDHLAIRVDDLEAAGEDLAVPRASRVVEIPVPVPAAGPGPGEAGGPAPGGLPPRAIMGAVPEALAKPLLEALSEKFGPGAVAAARAELDSDDLEELARSHGLSHDEVVSFIHDFIDLIRRRSEFVVPDLEVEEPADA